MSEIPDMLRSLLLVAAGLACGVSLAGAVIYARAFRERRVRFDLALFLTLVGVSGLSLYGLLSVVARIGQPHLVWTFPLALSSTLALVFGLLGVIFEQGRAERK